MSKRRRKEKGKEKEEKERNTESFPDTDTNIRMLSYLISHRFQPTTDQAFPMTGDEGKLRTRFCQGQSRANQVD